MPRSLYFILLVMGKDWFEVGPDMQIYILERLFCKQYRGKIPEADRAGKQIIVIDQTEPKGTRVTGG